MARVRTRFASAVNACFEAPSRSRARSRVADVDADADVSLNDERRRASIVDTRVRLDSTRESAPSRDVFMIIVYSRDLVGVVDPSRVLDLDDSRRFSSSFDAREKNGDARCSSDPVLLNFDDTNERTDERMNRRTVCRSSRRTSRRFDHTPRSALRTNSTLCDVTRNLPSRVRVDVNVPTTRRRVRETTRALVDGDDVVRTPHHASSSSPSPSREDGTVSSSPPRSRVVPPARGFRGPARGRRTTTRRGTNERSIDSLRTFVPACAG